MNKKLIRLTEQDLHKIVKESVNKILNEIGDTAKGQYMLGRLNNKQLGNHGKTKRGIDISHYAFGKRADAAQDVLDKTKDKQAWVDTFNDLRDAYLCGDDFFDDTLKQKYFRKKGWQ